MSERSSSLQVGQRRDTAIVWIMSTASVLFLVPLIAMQFTSEVAWDETDFLVWAILLFTAGSACLWIGRKVPRRRWVPAGALIAVVFFYVWAELAVGIFTSIGS